MKIYISDDVQQVRDLYQPLLPLAASHSATVSDFISRQADYLAMAHRQKNDAACVQISNWHPPSIGQKTAAILQASFTAADAQLTLAREYGFQHWAALQEEGEVRLDVMFEQAVDALVRGEIDLLQQLLGQRPSLTSDRSQFGHHATLLHYVGSNGVETYRQVVPSNLAAITQLLIEYGAEVNAMAKMYGGSTPLGLLLTSAHPYQAGVGEEVAAVLQRAGAHA